MSKSRVSPPDGDMEVGMFIRLMTLAAALALTVSPSIAQTPAVTADDYARAEKFMGYNTNPLVLHVANRPVWLSDDRFWYRVSTENGNEFILVDPIRGTRTAAFDHAKLAAALSAAAGTKYEAYSLPFTQFD